MLQVYLTKGLSGSGKTTWAREMVAQRPGKIKLVCKDDLRAMLDNGLFTRENEEFVKDIRDAIIVAALSKGKDVIVADTNLDPVHERHIANLIEQHGFKATVVIKDFTDVPLETCITRDLQRPQSVGKDVILQQWHTYLIPAPPAHNPKLSTVVICDLDGTLCLNDHRNPYDATTCDNDELNLVAAAMLTGKKVIFVSGREDKYRIPTDKFFTKHASTLSNLGITTLGILLRPTGDSRKDAIVKQEMYESEIKPQFNVEFVIDDRPQVITMWRSLGLKVYDLGQGINF